MGDDLTPDQKQYLLDQLFPPGSNARAIIDSTPPGELAYFDQVLATARERKEHEQARSLLLRLFDPEWADAEDEERQRQEAEADAALEAMTSQDWAALDAEVKEAERQILRGRGIEPKE